MVNTNKRIKLKFILCRTRPNHLDGHDRADGGARGGGGDPPDISAGAVGRRPGLARIFKVSQSSKISEHRLSEQSCWSRLAVKCKRRL